MKQYVGVFCSVALVAATLTAFVGCDRNSGGGKIVTPKTSPASLEGRFESSGSFDPKGEKKFRYNYGCEVQGTNSPMVKLDPRLTEGMIITKADRVLNIGTGEAQIGTKATKVTALTSKSFDSVETANEGGSRAGKFEIATSVVSQVRECKLGDSNEAGRLQAIQLSCSDKIQDLSSDSEDLPNTDDLTQFAGTTVVNDFETPKSINTLSGCSHNTVESDDNTVAFSTGTFHLANGKHALSLELKSVSKAYVTCRLVDGTSIDVGLGRVETLSYISDSVPKLGVACGAETIATQTRLYNKDGVLVGENSDELLGY